MIRRFSLIFLTMLGACTGNGGDAPSATLDVISISPDSAVFLPIEGDWPLQAELIAGAVSRGLVKLDGNGQVLPDLATSWRVSDDGLSIIFRLRKAEWSDGRTVTGDDFVKLFRGVLAPGSRHPFKALLAAIENGEDVAAGRKPPSALGVSAPIPEAVEIRLSAPRPSLLQVIAHPAMGLADRNMSKFALGPFKLTRTAEDRILLSPNPRFSDPGAVQLSGIRMAAQSEAGIALQRFKQQRAGLLLGGTTGDFQMARGAALDRFLQLDPVRGIYGYRPRKMDGPLGDPRVRQALAMVVDREALASATGAGTASPVYGMVSWGLSELPQPAAAGWTKLSMAARLTDAQTLMRSARGDLNGNPLVLRVALPAQPGHRAIMEQVARSWAPLGVTVEAVKADAADADLAVIETIAPADNAAWFLNQYRCRKKAYCNTQVDAALDRARAAPDAASRRQAMSEAERLLVIDQPIIPLFTPIRWSMVDPSVLGWSANALAQHPLAVLSAMGTQRTSDSKGP